MRALILAPSLPSAAPNPSAAGGERFGLEGGGWLGAALAQRGFRVHVVDDAEVARDVARAAEGLGADDVMLVHLSGSLARRGVLRAGGGRWLALRDVGTALAALPCRIGIIAELEYEEHTADPLAAAEHVTSAVAAVGARERGYTMALAVRAGSADAPLAFTRLLLAAADGTGATGTLAAAYDRVVSTREGAASSQSFTLVRGASGVPLSAPADLPPAPPSPPLAPPTPKPIPLPQAVAPDANPPPDYEALIAAATEAREWARVVGLRRARLPDLLTAQARARELVTIARVLQVEMGEAEAAITALEEARALAPSRVGVLQALRRGYEKLGRWASAIEVVGALAGLEQSGAARAELRVALAAMVLEQLQDEERAAGLLEAALKDDPTNAAALGALQRLRSPSALPEKVEGPAIPEEEPTGELPAFRESEPPSERVAVPEGDPFDPAAQARAFDERMRAGHIDAAFLSALVLEELGAARPEHLGLIEKLRTTTPVRARTALDDGAWKRLRARGADPVLEALFGAVARASSVARVEQLIARDRLLKLDPAARLPEESTASASRMFRWAAQVLSVECPEIYLVEDVPGDIAAVRAAVPSTAIAPNIVRGRPTKELAFLVARHLTYYRREHQALIYFPTHDELERLVLACVELVAPGSTGADDHRAVVALKARLERLVTPEEHARMSDAVHQLLARGVQASLGRWARSVELTAGRAGLFLCGDLATGTGVVDVELRGIAGVTADERRKDLIEFTSTEAFASLRSELVVE